MEYVDDNFRYVVYNLSLASVMGRPLTETLSVEATARIVV